VETQLDIVTIDSLYNCSKLLVEIQHLQFIMFTIQHFRINLMLI